MKAHIYLLIKNHEVVYVGMSKNPKIRIKNHHSKEYDHYVIFPRKNNCDYWEALFINFLKPTLNINMKYKNDLVDSRSDLFKGFTRKQKTIISGTGLKKGESFKTEIVC